MYVFFAAVRNRKKLLDYGHLYCFSIKKWSTSDNIRYKPLSYRCDVNFNLVKLHDLGVDFFIWGGSFFSYIFKLQSSNLKKKSSHSVYICFAIYNVVDHIYIMRKTFKKNFF